MSPEYAKIVDTLRAGQEAYVKFGYKSIIVSPIANSVGRKNPIVFIHQGTLKIGAFIKLSGADVIIPTKKEITINMRPIFGIQTKAIPVRSSNIIGYCKFYEIVKSEAGILSLTLEEQKPKEDIEYDFPEYTNPPQPIITQPEINESEENPISRRIREFTSDEFWIKKLTQKIMEDRI